MARMPDGWVIVAESDKLGVEVRLKEYRELVMCKNCAWYDPEPHGDVPMCYKGLGYTHPDDYCSKGERRAT